MVRAIESQGAGLFADEQAFIPDLDLVATEPVTVTPASPEGLAVKRMSTLRRRPDLSAEEFRGEWQIHADLVKRMPGVAGYVQHVVVARGRDDESGKSGTPAASYDEVSLDGVVEMWFRDIRYVESAFSSPAGQETMRHATTFLADINTYLVDCIRIL
jgi:hypothetical protein